MAKTIRTSRHYSLSSMVLMALRKNYENLTDEQFKEFTDSIEKVDYSLEHDSVILRLKPEVSA